MTRLFFDANTLLIPVQFGVDVFEEALRVVDTPVTYCVLDRVVEEVKALAATKTKDAPAAKVALQLVKQKDLKGVPGSLDKSVDDALVEACEPGDWVVTQDKELKKKLKAKGVKVITLRNKNHLTKA